MSSYEPDRRHRERAGDLVTKSKRDHLTKRTRKQLEEALKHAEALCDSSDKSICGVAPEHKEAVKLYVNTWIGGYLRAALNNDTWTEKYLG